MSEQDSSASLPRLEPNQPQSQLSSGELRKRLIRCCDESEALIKQAVEEHESLDERKRSDRLALCRSLLGTLSEMLLSEEWIKSPFISKLIEPITELQSDLQKLEQSLLDKKKPQRSSKSRLFAVGKHAAGQLNESEQMSIYILLYQVDGPNMRKWTAQLKNLSHSIISRPIYATEKEVQTALKQRDHVETDAYIKMSIPSSILLDQGDEQRNDRLGQPLLALTSADIDSDSVEYFMYRDRCYLYQDEKLEEMDHNESDSSSDES